MIQIHQKQKLDLSWNSAKYLEEGPIPSFQELKDKYKDDCPDAMQYYHFFIRNDGTLDELYDKTDKILVPLLSNIIREKSLSVICFNLNKRLLKTVAYFYIFYFLL
jgi:hypothetical protein